MKYSQLIEKCVELIDSYVETLMTPDSHAEEFLASFKCENTERVFLRQVFYGFQRYKSFLKVSNDIIFTEYSGTTNRKNDSTLFSVFTYLVCFRMDQLPFAQFRKIVLSQDTVKMNVLLSFLFNLQKLQEKVFPKWQQHLQLAYLQDNLLPKLAQRKMKCEDLLNRISEMATGKKAEGVVGTQNNFEDMKDKKKGTVTQEFKLTKPRPKQIPELEKIEVGFKANPAPKNKKDLKKIEEEKEMRRRQIKESMVKYYEQHKQEHQFELETTKRPTNLPKIKQQVQRLQTKDIKRVVAKPMPKYGQVDVKLNVAAILREEKKLNEKIQEEEQRMRNLEVNMRDESEFEQWKKDMKEKDKYDELELQQRRKIEMELAREGAVRAYEEKIQEKRALVEDMREIADELRAERQLLQQQSLQSKKKVIEQVQMSKENIELQKQKIAEKNRRIHDEQKEERKRILEKKKQQQKEEMAKRKELIQEIRELEKKTKAQPKQEIEHVSIGLLEEMTLEQLRTRLSDVRKEQREEEQQRRQANKNRKQQFKDTINSKKDAIMAYRQERSKQANQERQKKKEKQEAQKQRLLQLKTNSMNEYKKKEEQKLQERKAEKQKLAKEIKLTQQRRMFLKQGQAQQEANQFNNLQKGEERELLNEQNAKLIEQYQHQSVKQKELRILADQNKKAVQSKITFNRLYNETLAEGNMLAERLQQEDQAAKALLYHQVRTFEQKHNENMAKTNPYNLKVTQLKEQKGA